MRLYYAPLEGITGRVFRKAHAEIFGCTDRYFTPFIFPNDTGRLSDADMWDLDPAANEGLHLVPQLLANDADAFIATAKTLKSMGYPEINLNLGCPSATVTRKGRGAGLLKDPEALEKLLDRIYSGLDMPVSLKTRIGLTGEDEFDEILEVYRKFPASEMIIHPRLRTDFYRGRLHLNCYEKALQYKDRWPLCYNGDIFDKAGFEKTAAMFPDTERFMIGRGFLANPALARQIQGGPMPSNEELLRYHALIHEGYEKMMPGSRKVIFLLKEQWCYIRFIMGQEWQPEIEELMRITDSEAFLKKAEHILKGCRIIPEGRYDPLQIGNGRNR